MMLKEGGEQYHDEHEDAVLEDYFDISPEVLVPRDEGEADDLFVEYDDVDELE